MASLESDIEGNAPIPLSDDCKTYLAEMDGKLIALTERDRTTATSTKLIDKKPKAATYRTHRGWVILDYTGCQTLVNGLRVADYKRIHEGDVIQIGNARVTLVEILRKRIAEGSDLLTPDKICHFCYYGFEVGQDVVYCTQCGAPYHFDCWLYFAKQEADSKKVHSLDAGDVEAEKEGKALETEVVYELQCPSCGASHRIDPKRHGLEVKQSQGEGTVCPHCGQVLKS